MRIAGDRALVFIDDRAADTRLRNRGECLLRALRRRDCDARRRNRVAGANRRQVVVARMDSAEREASLGIGDRGDGIEVRRETETGR